MARSTMIVCVCGEGSVCREEAKEKCFHSGRPRTEAIYICHSICDSFYCIETSLIYQELHHSRMCGVLETCTVVLLAEDNNLDQTAYSIH